MQRLALDIHCGAGGWTLGLQRAGFTVLGGVDKSPSAVKTYVRMTDCRVFPPEFSKEAFTRWADRRLHEALYTQFGIGPEELDLIVGRIRPYYQTPISSFQEFEGIKISNAWSFLSVLPYVLAFRPKMFVFEFYREKLVGDYIHAYHRWRNILQAHDYRIQDAPILLSKHGVPQERTRVYLWGWDSKRVAPLTSLLPSDTSHAISVKTALAGLPDPSWRGRPWQHQTHLVADEAFPSIHLSRRSYHNDQDELHVIGGSNPHTFPRFDDLQPGVVVDEYGVPVSGDRGFWPKDRQRYLRLDPDQPSVSLSDFRLNQIQLLHPFDPRPLTVREMARLQTFDDDWTCFGAESERQMLVLSATPPHFARVVGEDIRRHLDEPRNNYAARLRLLALPKQVTPETIWTTSPPHMEHHRHYPGLLSLLRSDGSALDHLTALHEDEMWLDTMRLKRAPDATQRTIWHWIRLGMMLGLLVRKEDQICVTPFGAALRRWSTLWTVHNVGTFAPHIAQALAVADPWPLIADHPADSPYRLRPCRIILRALLELRTLRITEVEQTLMKVQDEAEVAGAIEQIRTQRQYAFPEPPSSRLLQPGAQAARNWLRLASFGGLLCHFTLAGDEASLRPQARTAVKIALHNRRQCSTWSSSQEYAEWIGEIANCEGAME